MSTAASDFAEFQRRVIETPRLFAELESEPDREAFAARAVRLGAKLGYRFGSEEVNAALTAARCAWLQRNVL